MGVVGAGHQQAAPAFNVAAIMSMLCLLLVLCKAM